MGQDGGTLRSRLLGRGQPTEEPMVAALESHLEETEEVVYRLTSSHGIVHETDEGTNEKASGDGGTLLAVTDRRLVFVVDTGPGVNTTDIPYTDLRSIDVDGGLLQTSLALVVWGRGRFRFRPYQSDTAREVAEFAVGASDAWQRAVAALQAAEQQITELSNHVEAGEMTAAERTRARIDDRLQTARRRADGATAVVRTAIEERVASVERELARARMDARFERSRRLGDEVDRLAEDDDYDAAYAAVERARTHLDVALSIATEHEFPGADSIRSERDSLEESLGSLEERPLRRAERALDRARKTGDRQAAVAAWEHALQCYRDALTAGWGTDAEFAGGTGALRLQVEWLVAKVVRLRLGLADRYETDGDAFQVLGAETLANDRYETACGHLVAAERLASQYRAGDTGRLYRRFEWIATKVDGSWTALTER
jgi:hypothetical protein